MIVKLNKWILKSTEHKKIPPCATTSSIVEYQLWLPYFPFMINSAKPMTFNNNCYIINYLIEIEEIHCQASSEALS